MKKYFFISISVIVAFICSASGGKGGGVWEGEESFSPAMIHLRVDQTLKEHERQKKMNKNQTINTTEEGINKTQWEKFKDVTKNIQNRLRYVDFVLQAIPTGYVITEKTKEIYQTQKSIYAEIKTAPKYLQKILPKQIKFYDDLQMMFIRDAKMAERLKNSQLKYYVERDKALVNDIMKKIRKF